MDRFEEVCKELFGRIGNHRKMVLSTAANQKVTSRMMSIIIIDGKFYFQTDVTFRKCKQLKENPQVALCMDEVQIEGICEEVGVPIENAEFCKMYETYFPGSYKCYTHLGNERLFEVSPTFVQRWIYENGVPFVESYDFINSKYSKIEYVGE
ncbi:pyridoxamine 5'-phosphate oxidase family protein [Blautia schinkii]|nr:pyridoxamine 5'-phosphate oxidase family protein [Blautia schinkii]